MEASQNKTLVNYEQWLRYMFEVHYAPLGNYIFYKTADHSISRTTLIETFKIIWAERKRYGGQQSFSKPYIVASKLIRKKRLPALITFDFKLKINEDPAHLRNLNISNEAVRVANSILSKMATFSRTVLLMNRVDGFTAEEISQRLNISARDILSTLNKASKQAEDLLKISVNKPQEKSICLTKFLDLLPHITISQQQDCMQDEWEALMLSIRKDERFGRIVKGIMRWGGLALALIIILSIAAEWRFATVTHKTPRGKIAYFLLPDSTFVTLNAESSAHYRRFGWKKSKVVKLTGEAYFDLLPEVNSLTVKTGEVTTIPGYGAVNIFYRNHTVNIHCLGGDTQVDIFEKGLFKLRPNEGLEYSHDLHSHRIEPIIPSEVKAWTRGEFYYTNEPLAKVLNEIERQYDVDIQREGIALDMHYFSGFFTSNNLDIALERVCSQNLLEYSIDWRTRTVVIK